MKCKHIKIVSNFYAFTQQLKSISQLTANMQNVNSSRRL